MADYIDRRYVLFAIQEHKRVAEDCSAATKELSDLLHDQLVVLVKMIPANCEFKEERND